MVYSLGEGSLAELVGVDDRLVKVVKRAIQITRADFTVEDGHRSQDEQRQNVNKGVSQTMKSMHLIGHAVDLVPFFDHDGDGDGELVWEWEHIYMIARAMQQAANELGVRLVWGGCWDRSLNDLGDPKAAAAAYVERRKAAGKKAFLDGPHYELDQKVYPA